MSISKLALVAAFTVMGCDMPGDDQPPAGGSSGDTNNGGSAHSGGASAGNQGTGDAGPMAGEGVGAESGNGAVRGGGSGATSNAGTGATSNAGMGATGNGGMGATGNGGMGATGNGGMGATGNGGTGAAGNGGSTAGSEQGAGTGNVPTCAAGVRLPSVPWPEVGLKPFAVTAADFNGDGVVDLASVDREYGQLSILLGKGDGTFGARQMIDALYEQFRAIDAADLDGDGRAELIVMSEYNKRLFVYPNDGTGTFAQKPTTYQLETLYPPQYDGATRVRTADLNQDGKIDVALVSSGKVKILMGKGDGTLAGAVEYWAGPDPADPLFSGLVPEASNLVVADVNGDHVLDLVTANTVDARVGILLGNGNGTFQQGYQIRGYTRPAAVAVADFDDDGKVDLAIANSNNRVKLVRGNGLGGFELAGYLDIDFSATDVVSGDFNADGKNDLAVADSLGTLRIFVGKGDGSFLPDVTYQGYADPYPAGLPQALLTTDLNKDGVPDVVMANSGASSLGVFLGRKGAPPLGERMLSIGTGTSVRFQTAGVTHVDFNRDGRPDLVASAFYTNEISVMLALPGGGFAPSLDLPVLGEPLQVVAADFNNDDNPDLAYATMAGSVGILLGDGKGGVLEQDAGAPAPAPAPDGVFYFVVADVNGDHNADLITSGNRSYVMLGKGNGTFQEAIQGPVTNFEMATADFDHDGKIDVAMAGYDDVVVAFGKGDGTFENVSFGVGEKCRGIAVADFDGDGNADLATTTYHGVFYDRDTVNHVSVLLGKGTHQFGQPVAFPTSRSTVRGAADMNGDGKPDLILAGRPTLGVLLNQGNGSFGVEQDYPAGGDAADDLTVADFNGDGAVDIATATVFDTTERESGGVAVLLNKTCGGVVSDDAWGSTSKVGDPNGMAGRGWSGDAYVRGEPSTREIPGVIFVSEQGPADGDGSSWAKAIPDLRAALQWAAGGGAEQVWVAGGYYAPNRQPYYSWPFALATGVAVYGGFDGLQADDLSDRDLERYETFLDADLYGDNDTNISGGEDASLVVYASDVGPSAILDGFTVQFGGTGDDSYMPGNIYVEGNAPTLRNLKIRWSSQTTGGVVLDGGSSTPAVWENLVFEDNGGRALTVYAGADLTCRHCSFRNNVGGVYLSSQSNDPITARFIDTDFKDMDPGDTVNEVVASGAVDVTLARCVFPDGSATLIGNLQDASMHIIDSIAVGRKVPWTYDYAFALSTTDPGKQTTLDIVNSTFANNGKGHDPFINVWDGGPVNVRVYNSVLQNPGPEISSNTTYLTLEVSHSVFDDENGPVAGSGNVSGNLLLDAAGRPQAGSPLINAGTGTVPNGLLKDYFDLDHDGNTTELLPQDFAGSARAVGTIDIGAFETKP